MIKITLALAISFLLSSCATRNPVTEKYYDGPDKSLSELAILQSVSPRIFVEEIDGKTLANLKWAKLGVSEALILPGEHTISIYYTHVKGSKVSTIKNYSDTELKFTAKPGHSYIVKYKTYYKGRDEYASFWVQDMGKYFYPKCKIKTSLMDVVIGDPRQRQQMGCY